MKRLWGILAFCCINTLIIAHPSFGEIQETPTLTYQIVSTIPTPGPSPKGLAWDGSHLWVADDSTDTIYRINPADGRIVSTIPSPGGRPWGIAWDGSHIWVAENEKKSLFKLNPATGEIVHTIAAEYPSIELRPLAWDGKSLWSAYYAGWSSKIAIVNPETGTWQLTEAFPIADGITFQGNDNIWIVVSTEGISGGNLYRHTTLPPDKFLSPRLGQCKTPLLYPTGLVFDGAFFWIADCKIDSLYKFKVDYPLSINNIVDTPKQFYLSTNYPNPFNGKTTFSYMLLKESFISVAIYDVLGKKIRDIVECNMQAGKYISSWDGKDNNGKEVGTGQYYLKLNVGKSIETKKMMFIK
jgi:hypothetical protein